jgi:hypothetical protein
VENLRRDSAALNNQLARARELNRELQESFDRYETERLALLSSKNGEIAELKRTVTGKTAEAEKHKGVSRSRLYVIIAFAGSWVVFIAFKVCRFFRLF